jgi:hypothetical protein
MVRVRLPPGVPSVGVMEVMVRLGTAGICAAANAAATCAAVTVTAPRITSVIAPVGLPGAPS